MNKENRRKLWTGLIYKSHVYLCTFECVGLRVTGFSVSIYAFFKGYLFNVFCHLILLYMQYLRRPSPKGNDAFPPVSDFPLFSKIFQSPCKIFKILQIYLFLSAKSSLLF